METLRPRQENHPTMQPTFYMCPPKYFNIEFMLNIWTDIHTRVNAEQAMRQWEHLYRTYRRLGVEVEVLEPARDAPELSFVGDSVFVYGQHAIPARFRFEERMSEVAQPFGRMNAMMLQSGFFDLC